ncbi:hypothetical protein [Brunnivagina elsteri]|nr:hypothetical protein [Calothrix elsteri]
MAACIVNVALFSCSLGGIMDLIAVNDSHNSPLEQIKQIAVAQSYFA